MPTYLYECESEGRFEIYQPITSDSLTACPDCQSPVKKIIVPVMLGAGTGDTRKGSRQDAEFSRQFEAKLERDRPAYKALKDQGYLPKSVMGAERIMTEAKTQLEIETGRVMPGKTAQIESLVSEFAEKGMNLLKKDMKTGKRTEAPAPIPIESAVAS